MMNFLLQVVDIDDLNKHVCFLVGDEKQSSVWRERKRGILLAFVYLKKPQIYISRFWTKCLFNTSFPVKKIDTPTKKIPTNMQLTH